MDVGIAHPGDQCEGFRWAWVFGKRCQSNGCKRDLCEAGFGIVGKLYDGGLGFIHAIKTRAIQWTTASDTGLRLPEIDRVVAR